MPLKFAVAKILERDLKRIDKLRRRFDENIVEPRWSVVKRALDLLEKKRKKKRAGK